MLAKAGPNGDSVAMLSTCLHYLLLKMKNDSLVTLLSKLQKSSLGVLGGFSLPLYMLPMQIPMV